LRQEVDRLRADYQRLATILDGIRAAMGSDPAGRSGG
jgi:hypothetical protein